MLYTSTVTKFLISPSSNLYQSFWSHLSSSEQGMVGPLFPDSSALRRKVEFRSWRPFSRCHDLNASLANFFLKAPMMVKKTEK